MARLLADIVLPVGVPHSLGSGVGSRSLEGASSRSVWAEHPESRTACWWWSMGELQCEVAQLYVVDKHFKLLEPL